MNPGSPASQASILIQPRLRAPSTRLLYSCNINADVKGKIINTLLKLKNNGLEEQTVKIVGFYLNNLAVNIDLRRALKQKLGWKKLETALFYLQRMDLGSQEYHSATANSVSEATKLVEQGFDYVTDVDGVKLFRKRK